MGGWQLEARPPNLAMDETLVPTDDPSEVEDRLAMPLAEAMFTQRAVRRVQPDPIHDRIVLRCLELALEAPTGSNGQNWEFVVVKDRASWHRWQRNTGERGGSTAGSVDASSPMSRPPRS